MVSSPVIATPNVICESSEHQISFFSSGLGLRVFSSVGASSNICTRPESHLFEKVEIEGIYLPNVFNGQVTCKLSSSQFTGVIIGEYTNGIPNSEFVYLDENNEVIRKGLILNGKKEGLWVSSSTIGRYKNGLKEGQWISRRKLTEYVMNYTDGVLNGKYSSTQNFCTHGAPPIPSEIEIGEFENGVPVNKWVKKDEYGKYIYEGNYENYKEWNIVPSRFQPSEVMKIEVPSIMKNSSLKKMIETPILDEDGWPTFYANITF